MWKIEHTQTGLWRVSNGSFFDKNATHKFFKTEKAARAYLKKMRGYKMAKSTKKRKKLSGNALKQKAYSLIKKGAAKLVRAKGRGNAGKEKVGVYIYKLKPRKK